MAFYRCSQCKKKYKLAPKYMVCPVCSVDKKDYEPLKGVLDVHYSQSEIKKWRQSQNPLDFLPVSKKYFPKLKIDSSPLIYCQNIAKKWQFNNVYVKYEGAQPTGSFKDRASLLVAAFAKKQKIKKIVLAPTGNAASSMAGIGASAGLDVTVFVPESAPQAKLVQCVQYGARLKLVKGNYDLAFEQALKYATATHSMCRNTGYNPLTIEGKKTVSLEITFEMGQPDFVFVPVGDGVILSGVIKGFKDLLLADKIKKMPLIVGVQASGSMAMIRAQKQGGYFKDVIFATTVADSISVDVPKNGYHALQKLNEVKGQLVSVDDIEILGAQKQLSSLEGIFIEPASAAAFAGFIKLKKQIVKNKKIVILGTGSGLKDIKGASKAVQFKRELSGKNWVLKKEQIK